MDIQDDYAKEPLKWFPPCSTCSRKDFVKLPAMDAANSLAWRMNCKKGPKSQEKSV